MLTRQDFKLRQKVYFGRTNGEKTLGEIVKLNPTKAKVKTLEDRGNGRGSVTGSVWNVPYSMLTSADANTAPGTPAPLEKIKYNPWAGIENRILEALLIVHSGLSPENLSCDGELSRTEINRRYSELQRQLRGLTMALGRNLDESQVYDWEKSRQEYEKSRKTA